VHTAALKAVGESLEKADEYFQVNLEATNEVLAIAKRTGVKKFIFSSTAAVYGSPDSMDPCKELGPKAPISPYGDSKYQAESGVSAFINTSGNSGTSLRFFNVVGCAKSPELLDNSVENLVPIVINKLKAGESPVIFGTDYPTPDGTCIRDYVDVRDISRAHLAAANATTKLPDAMNIGTGRGASVREIIKLVLDATGKSDTQVIENPRRAGDPAFLCADVVTAKEAMGFESQYSLEASIRSLFPEMK
jgi:UDP-glucose 4-epimerase